MGLSGGRWAYKQAGQHDMTDTQRRALTILRNQGPILASRFSELMWPDSLAHNRVHNCGPNGATRGRMIWMSGGAYLGKLRKLGWARGVRQRGAASGLLGLPRFYDYRHEITQAGKEALGRP